MAGFVFLGKIINYSTMFFAIWTFINLTIIAIKWLQSIGLKPAKPHYIDLRNDKSKSGKNFTIAAVKANPLENIWFGHIWIIWHEAPPHSNGLKEVGFYAKCRISAAINLIGSTISPFALWHGQKPIEATLQNDEGLKRDWQLNICVDENIYNKALEIDKNWRNEKRYVLRPPIGGKTYSCRDYCLQIAEVVGLRANHNKWADFPPITFHNFLIENNIIAHRKNINKIYFFKQKLKFANANN
jgi:hypothetical protein